MQYIINEKASIASVLCVLKNETPQQPNILRTLIGVYILYLNGCYELINLN